MVLARFARGDGAAIVIDGVVALIAVTALVLTAFIGIRAAIDTFRGQNLSTLVGVRLLAPDDVLVTFEDFELENGYDKLTLKDGENGTEQM